MKKNLFALAVAAVLGFAGAAHATEESASIAVTGTISASCTISSPATLDLGAMAKDEVKTVTGNLQVNCPTSIAYTVKPHSGASLSISGTKNGSPHSASVTMTGASTVATGFGTLGLFKDAGATSAWSDSATIAGTGNGSAQSLPIAIKFTHDGANFGNFSFTLQPTVAF